MDNSLPNSPGDNFNGDDTGQPNTSDSLTSMANALKGTGGTYNTPSAPSNGTLSDSNVAVATTNPPIPMDAPQYDATPEIGNDPQTYQQPPPESTTTGGFGSTPMSDIQANDPWSTPDSLPEIPMVPVNNEPPLPIIETSLPTMPSTPAPGRQYTPSPSSYNSNYNNAYDVTKGSMDSVGARGKLSDLTETLSLPSLPFNKSRVLLALSAVFIVGAGFFILNMLNKDNGSELASEDPFLPEDPSEVSIITEPVAEEDKVELAENVSMFTGNYRTSTDILPEEIPDSDSSEPDIPRRYDRSLVLNSNNTATMTSIVDEKTVVESGNWAYNLSSDTIKIEFTTTSEGQVDATRVLTFDAIDGDVLVAQSYEKFVYPDVDMVFYKE